jgi:hypothetical protein
VSRRWWFVVGAITALFAAIVMLGPTSPERSPDHRSDSYAPDGSSALVAYARALGYQTASITGTFKLPAGGVLFVFSPDQEFTAEQAVTVHDWVARGGTLVYADAVGDSALDARFDLTTAGRVGARTLDPAAEFQVRPLAPFFDGVERLVGGPDPRGFDPGPEQVALLAREGSSVAIAVEARVGAGRIVALGDPLLLCNHYLGQADNGHLAAALFALAPAGGRITIDEFHHGLIGGSGSPLDWTVTPVGGPIAWALIVGYICFLLRGSALGPRIPIRGPADRSSAEYARAVGAMLRRARARRVSLGVMVDSTRRALGERSGLGHNAPPERVGQVLAQRAPLLARELERAEAAAATAGSDAAFLDAARRLHGLAYPTAKRFGSH